MIRRLKTMTSLPNKCKLTLQAMQTGQPALSELMTNRSVQLRTLINRQLRVKAADEEDDDIMITGTGHTTPGNPVALSKHTPKDDLSAIGKGKWNADLSSFANLNVQDIHSGFLNRLYTSRDYEASLVNLMKERYEVTTIFLFCPIAVYQLLVAPKWRFMIPI